MIQQASTKTPVSNLRKPTKLKLLKVRAQRKLEFQLALWAALEFFLTWESPS